MTYGRINDIFAMNEKCAAETGRLLEHTAKRLNVSLNDMEAMGVETSVDAVISSDCTVFAESEFISLFANGVILPT